jgi:hypothetical protein
MSIFIDAAQVSNLRIQAKSKLEAYSTLFHDLERGTLAVARRRAVQQRANGMDRLAVAPDHATDIALTQLHFEDGRSSTRNFREHHVVWKFNELPNHELKKLSHLDPNNILPLRLVTLWPPRSVAVKRRSGSDRLDPPFLSFGAANRARRLQVAILACAGFCRLAYRRSCGLLSVFLDQTANRIRWLRAPREPMFHAIEFQRAVMPGLLRIVGADDFDEFAVARIATVGHDDFVIRAIQCAFSP